MVKSPRRLSRPDGFDAPKCFGGMTTSPVFNELKREVLALIREESLRAASEGLASRVG